MPILGYSEYMQTVLLKDLLGLMISVALTATAHEQAQ